jgi:hypothetical protein
MPTIEYTIDYLNTDVQDTVTGDASNFFEQYESLYAEKDDVTFEDYLATYLLRAAEAFSSGPIVTLYDVDNENVEIFVVANIRKVAVSIYWDSVDERKRVAHYRANE